MHKPYPPRVLASQPRPRHFARRISIKPPPTSQWWPLAVFSGVGALAGALSSPLLRAVRRTLH